MPIRPSFQKSSFASSTRPRRRRVPSSASSIDKGGLAPWLDGIVFSPAAVVIILLVWLGIALGLHCFLPDGRDDTTNTNHAWEGAFSEQRRQRIRASLSDKHKTRKRHKQQHNDKEQSMPQVPSNPTRIEYEQQFPPADTARIQNFVNSLRDDDLDAGISSVTLTGSTDSTAGTAYNVMDCPNVPPPNYPWHYPLLEVLEEWPVDELQWPVWDDLDNQHDSSSHPYLYHSVCIFDFQNPVHRNRITTYTMDYDVPVIVRNHPVLQSTTERWMRNDPAYLTALIGNEETQRTEHSTTNQLPFWRLPKSNNNRSPQERGGRPPGWKPPTENIFMTFSEWSAKSDALDQVIAQSQQKQATMDHYYFRLNGDPSNNAYLYDEIPIFDPDLTAAAGKNVFMWEPDQARGINCRMGMAGNVAAAHYDDSRNWIVLLSGGARRYILGHPRECANLALYPLNHPSGRHSWPNWSDIGPHNREGTTSEAAQALQDATVTQVVLQASDALYLPTHYFHFIVSLSRNYQCNARSGRTDTYSHFIRECGFPA